VCRTAFVTGPQQEEAMRTTGRTLLWTALLLALAGAAWGTTWAPRKIQCPLCETENTFQAPMSYGSYIYSWPSRFQMVFWPAIDSASIYSCKSCRLTCFMWDFVKIPKEKTEALRKALEGVTLTPDKAADDAKNPPPEYVRIPILEKLAAAQKVYEVVGLDDEKWCWFHRVVGYHAEAQRKSEDASRARRKALALAEKLLADPQREGQAKENRLIAGAMHYFLDDPKAARDAFEKAMALEYKDPSDAKGGGKGKDAYLTQLIADYLQVLDGTLQIPGRAAGDANKKAPDGGKAEGGEGNRR
jgi:hypothetical protein